MKILYRVWVVIAIFAWVTGAAGMKNRLKQDERLQSLATVQSEMPAIHRGLSHGLPAAENFDPLPQRASDSRKGY
jgi:hypothetical protein